MTSWQKLGLIVFGSGAVIWLLGQTAGPVVANIVTVFLAVVATPFGERLSRWVDTSSEFTGNKRIQGVQTSWTPLPRGEAATAFYIAAMNVYALFLMNLATAVLLVGLDNLEHAKLLRYFPGGYEEVQKYIAGCAFGVIWLPAATALSLVLGSRQRKLSLLIFVAGTAAALLIYLVSAKEFGLSTGVGDPSQVFTAIGARSSPTPQYNGYRITALLIQFCMLAVLGIFLALYQWATARLARAASHLARRAK